MAIVNLVVHHFTVGDVEDPDLYAADPLIKWERSEVGQWVMDRSVEPPEWHRYIDMNSWSHSYKIVAKLHEEDATFFNLKYRGYSQSKTMG